MNKVFCVKGMKCPACTAALERAVRLIEVLMLWCFGRATRLCRFCSKRNIKRGSRLKKVFCVKGMKCPACTAALERAVRLIEGVRAAEASLASSELTVESDFDVTAPVVAAIADAGFEYLENKQ